MKKGKSREKKVYTVTFMYASGATQTLIWDEATLKEGTNVNNLARDWKNDLKASSYSIATSTYFTG